jgi:hypothetical protein
MFQVVGTSSGSSAASANFSIKPGGNVDDEDGNNNSTSISYTVLITLPVTLTQFDVIKSGCNIAVSFNTDEEKNVSMYAIEASKDGNVFSTLGEVPAANAGKYVKTFPITESLKATSLFVRVKTIDKDAKISYSAIRKIAGTCDGQKAFALSLYPNPVTVGKQLTVVATDGSFAGRYNVSLLDLNGRTLQVKQIQLNNVGNFNFGIGNLLSGHYLLRVVNTTGDESAVIHFQKNQ